MAITATIVGNVGKYVRDQTTKNGKALLGFTVAGTPSRWDQQTSSYENIGEPLWVDVTIWERDAEKWRDHITPGVGVVMTATLSLESYETQAGETHRKLVALYPKLLGLTPRHGGNGAGDGPGSRVSTQGPAGGAQDDPWAASDSGSFDDAPPF